jgi:hypothetical protein
VVCLRKERQDCCCQECTESGEVQHLRVVGGRAQEVCAKSLKESEELSSGGNSSFLIQWEQTQERFEQGEASSSGRNPQGGELTPRIRRADLRNPADRPI